MKMLRLIVLYLTIISLLSCVMESTKPSAQDGSQKTQSVEVDSDVEDDLPSQLSHRTQMKTCLHRC